MRFCKKTRLTRFISTPLTQKKKKFKRANTLIFGRMFHNFFKTKQMKPSAIGAARPLPAQQILSKWFLGTLRQLHLGSAPTSMTETHRFFQFNTAN